LIAEVSMVKRVSWIGSDSATGSPCPSCLSLPRAMLVRRVHRLFNHRNENGPGK
jgi:hypothetical protein